MDYGLTIAMLVHVGAVHIYISLPIHIINSKNPWFPCVNHGVIDFLFYFGGLEKLSSWMRRSKLFFNCHARRGEKVYKGCVLSLYARTKQANNNTSSKHYHLLYQTYLDNTNHLFVLYLRAPSRFACTFFLINLPIHTYQQPLHISLISPPFPKRWTVPKLWTAPT